MTDLEKAARMALEALESIDGVGDVVRWHKQFEYFGKAITAIREALAEQPAQQKPWVGLTNEEWRDIVDDIKLDNIGAIKTAIEAKLKEKNNGTR